MIPLRCLGYSKEDVPSLRCSHCALEQYSGGQLQVYGTHGTCPNFIRQGASDSLQGQMVQQNRHKEDCPNDACTILFTC